MLYFIAKNFYWFQILFKSNGTNTLFPCISLCMIGFEKHWSKLNPSFLCLALIKSSGNRITLAPFIFFIKQLLVRKLSFYSLFVIYQECCDIKRRIVIFTNVCFSYFFLRDWACLFCCLTCCSLFLLVNSFPYWFCAPCVLPWEAWLPSWAYCGSSCSICWTRGSTLCRTDWVCSLLVKLLSLLIANVSMLACKSW